MLSTRLPPRRLRLSLRSLAMLSIGLGLAACGGGRPPRPPPGAVGGGEGGPAIALRPMEAKGLFFDGLIEVEVLLAPSGTHWSRGDEAGGNRRSAGRSRGRSGGVGMGIGGGGGGMRGGFGGGGGPRGGGGGPGERGGPPEGGAEGGAQRASMHASEQPPIHLRLRLTNHGAAPADVAVLDFDSALGNFVVQPEKITVKPGESAEAAPMVSRLGAPQDEIPLTVRLRVGDRSEQQVLTLRAVKDAPPEAAPPAPPVPGLGPSQAHAEEP